MLDFALLFQVIERIKQFRRVVDFSWWTMQLYEIECFDFEVFQAAIDERGDIFAIISRCNVDRVADRPWWRPKRCRSAVRAAVGNQTFATPVTVNVGSIEEVDAVVESGAALPSRHRHRRGPNPRQLPTRQS